jgi:hypothetical protein
VEIGDCPGAPLTFSCEYTPLAGDTLEGFGAAVVEAQPRARYQILDCARHQNLASTGKRRNPRAYVNSDTANIVADHFALACMEPSTDLYAERPDFLGNGTGAANAARWTVKGGEKAVSSCFHFMASKAREIAPDRGVMIVEKIAPALIAECGGFLGRADDVGEENRGEDAVDWDRGP